MPPASETKADFTSSAQGLRLAGLLVLVLLLVVGLNRYWNPSETNRGGSSAPADASLAVDPAEAITLEATRLTGEPLSIQLKHRPEMTVLDAMTSAARIDPRWEFEYEGRGQFALLTRLAGQPNGGRGGRNWQFEVNGKMAMVSFGAYRLKPGDRVLWKFAASE